VIARYTHKLFLKNKISPYITIISIDDKSIRTEDLKWPWPRNRFALLIDKISEHDPRVLAFDISFVGKSSYGKEDDLALINSIKNTADSTVLGSYIGDDNKIVLPAKDIIDTGVHIGLVNKLKDDRSIVRYSHAVASVDNELKYSLEVKTAALKSDVGIEDIKIRGRDLFVNNNSIRLNWDGTFPIKYGYNTYNFNTISASDIFNDNFDPFLIRNRIVMVGLTADSLHDIYTTPFGSIPGVILSANALENIIENNILSSLPIILVFMLLFLISILGAFAGLRFSLPKSILIVIASVFMLYLASIFSFKHSKDVDLFGLICVLISNYLIARLYLYIKSNTEKSKMLNLLTIDEATGLYNMYYLHTSLSQMIENSSDKRLKPALVIIKLTGKKESLHKLDSYSKKELALNITSIINANISRYSGFVSKISDTDFGVVFLSSIREEAVNLASSIYKKIDDLELILSNKKTKVIIKPSIGIAYAGDFEAPSVKAMIYASENGIEKTENFTSERIYAYNPEKEAIGLIEEKTDNTKTEEGLFGLVMEDLKNKNAHLSEKIGDLTFQISELRASYFGVITSLVKALEEKDLYTAGHSERVSGYSLKLAEEIGLTEESRDTIKKAALLHDIGKIGIPDKILNKKEDLTDDEKSIMNKHEIESIRILQPLLFLKDAVPVILHHHERYDGRGYPHGLSGERIPIGARILAVCDSYDAMTSGRSYNKPLDTGSAISILKDESGKQFDPNLVDKFIKVIKETPQT